MQLRPDHVTLLDGLASFLLSEVSPALDADKALQFRVLIAANLASIVAGELKTETERFDAEAARLAKLLPAEAAALPLSSPDRSTRLDALERLNRALVDRLNAGTVGDEALEHLLQTAKETLAVTNPRFDLTHGS